MKLTTQICLKHGSGVFFRVFLFLFSFHFVFTENYISIPLDLVGQSEFYLSRENPFIFSDYSLDAIKFDGSLGYPLGSYKVISFPKNNLPDSTKNISFLNWKQGDYDYREIDICTKSGSVIDGQLSFNGFGRSFPGVYGNLGTGNVLQNYYLNYEKKTEYSNIMVGSFYHLENTGLPLTDVAINRNSETFNNGIHYERNSNSYKYKLTSSFQTGFVTLGEKSYEHLTVWNSADIGYDLNKYFELLCELNSKYSSIQIDSTDDYSYRIMQFGGKWKSKKYFFTMMLSVDETNNLFPLFNAGYVSENMNLKITRYLSGYSEITDTISHNNYIRNSIELKFDYRQFSLESDVSLLEWNNLLIPLGSAQFKFVTDNLKCEVNGFFVQSDKVPINQYFTTTIFVSPQTEFHLLKYFEKLPIVGLLSSAPSKRFRTFAEINWIYYQSVGTKLLNYTSLYGFSKGATPIENISSQFNLSFGFQTSKFKFSYIMQNVLDSPNVMFNTMQPLTSFSFFEVEWMFEN